MTHMRLLCNACTAITMVAAAVLVAAPPVQAAAPFCEQIPALVERSALRVKKLLAI
jgi:hypothetical protein